MPFDAVVGNEAARDRLRGILAGDRPGHAYLFSGPDGVGKKLVALEFARAFGAEPLLIQRPEDRKEILVQQIRDVIRELSFRSASRRVIVFDEADRMSEEGMNALLKTLEEPPPGTILILVTSVAQRLLSTLRSRCQTILFFPLSDADMERHARTKLGLDAAGAGVVAALAAGSVGTATLLSERLDEILSLSREVQERVVSGELNPLIEALGRIRDTEQARRQGREELALLIHGLREALRARSGIPPRLATPAFLAYAERLDEDALLDRIELLLDHQRMIDLNANVGLAVEDALLRI